MNRHASANGPGSRAAQVAWWPFVLLGLLTIATLGGPLAILLTLRGGPGPQWPPDRPVEWWTFGVAISTYAVLLVATLAVGVVRWRRTVTATADRPRNGSSGAAG